MFVKMKKNLLSFIIVILISLSLFLLAYYFSDNTSKLHESKAVKMYEYPATVILLNNADIFDSKITITNFKEGNQFYSFKLKVTGEQRIGKDIEIIFKYCSYTSENAEEYVYKTPYFDFSNENLVKIPKVADTDYLLLEKFSCTESGTVEGYLNPIDLKSKTLLYKRGFNKIVLNKINENTIRVNGSVLSYSSVYLGLYNSDDDLVSIVRLGRFLGNKEIGTPSGIRYVKILDVKR